MCRFVFMFKESDEDLTPYAKLLKQLKSNHEWQKQISLGKRIGLYRIHEELGSGNFAQVKAATHCLTKGKEICSDFYAAVFHWALKPTHVMLMSTLSDIWFNI